MVLASDIGRPSRLVDAFAALHTIMRCMCRFVGSADLDRSMLRSARKLMTTCSGIGTVERAVAIVRALTRQHCQFSAQLESVIVCENSTACMPLMRDAGAWAEQCAPVLGQPPHRIHDILDLVPHASLPPDGQTYEQKVNHMLNCPRRASVPCREHQRDCTLPQVDVDMSGLPCTPFSASGNRLALKDPLIILYLAWLSYHCHCHTKLPILENVPFFLLNILVNSAGHLYYIYPVHMAPADVGFQLLKRDRLYIFMRHRFRTSLRHGFEELYLAVIDSCGEVRTSPEDLLIASVEDVEASVSCHSFLFLFLDAMA